jgi:hypothetical protein
MTPRISQPRRAFLQTTLRSCATFAALAAVPTVLITGCTKKSTERLPVPQGTQPLSEEDPVAKSLGYKHEASQVDTEKFPKRKGPEGEKQICKNCQFYKSRNESWGDCQILRSGVVAATGWCNTWAPIPAASA